MDRASSKVWGFLWLHLQALCATRTPTWPFMRLDFPQSARMHLPNPAGHQVNLHQVLDTQKLIRENTRFHGSHSMLLLTDILSLREMRLIRSMKSVSYYRRPTYVWLSATELRYWRARLSVDGIRRKVFGWLQGRWRMSSRSGSDSR